MYEHLIALFAGLARFLTPSYQSELDRYIASKNPQSPGEIEMWIREYNRDKGFFSGS